MEPSDAVAGHCCDGEGKYQEDQNDGEAFHFSPQTRLFSAEQSPYQWFYSEKSHCFKLSESY